jgi:hypothetical protein
MTLPYERSRAVIETRGFLEEIVADKRRSESLRYQARQLLRHYPYAFQVLQAALNECSDSTMFAQQIFGPDTDGASMRADALGARKGVRKPG